MKIRSKTEFYKLWEAGCLGNRSRLWRDPEQAYRWALLHGMPKLGIREVREKQGGAGAWEKPKFLDFWSTIRRWKREGKKFVIDDGAPDDYQVLQGELCRTYHGMEGYLAVGCHLPMRKAMAAGAMKHYSYGVTLYLLEKYMDPSSRDDVDALFDLFPEATIEFATFSIDVGVFPGRNTIFWEVRNY